MEFYIIQRVKWDVICNPEFCSDFSEAYSKIKREFDIILSKILKKYGKCEYFECEQKLDTKLNRRSAHAVINQGDLVQLWKITTFNTDILREKEEKYGE